jgi:hypothetical protein
MPAQMALLGMLLFCVPTWSVSHRFDRDIEPGRQGVVTDVDGNEYRTIRIGAHVWMAENLRVTRAPGSAIHVGRGHERSDSRRGTGHLSSGLALAVGC